MYMAKYTNLTLLSTLTGKNAVTRTKSKKGFPIRGTVPFFLTTMFRNSPAKTELSQNWSVVTESPNLPQMTFHTDQILM